MAVHFVLGRARAGKSSWCLDQIAEACRKDPLGPPVIYLVPEQATYSGEKALLTRLGGFTRAQVLSFTRIEDYVFAQAPAPTLPRLTATHRALLATLVVTRARRQPDAPPLIHAAGMEEALADFVSEARQYLAGPEELLGVAKRLEETLLASPAAPASAMLNRKLRQLADLLLQFTRLTEQRFEDPQQTMLTLTQTISSSDIFQGIEIYVDAFIGFSPAEERLLVALARRARTLHVALLAQPSRIRALDQGTRLVRDPVLQPVEETYERLRRIFRENDIAVDEHSFLDPPQAADEIAKTLVTVEQQFLSRARKPCADGAGIRFLEAPNPREEARQAVEVLAHWMEEHDWLPEDVGILTRDLETYAPSLISAFRTLKIPFFLDRNEPLETHPLVIGVQALVRAALRPFDTEQLIALAKSGLLPLLRSQVDLLEHHVRQHPRTMAEWYAEDAWEPPPSRSPFDSDDTPRAPGAEPVPDGIDTTRRYIVGEVQFFRSLYLPDPADPAETRTEGPFRDFLNAVIRTVDRNAKQLDVEPADLKILGRIGELFLEASEAAGAEVLAWEVAGDLVIRTLAALTLPRIPPLLGEVFVGQVDRSRQPRLKGVVILGLAEGMFPRTTKNMSLLNDTERDLVTAAGLDLKPNSRRLYEREALHAYRALTTASRLVALSRPVAREDGVALTPSPFWNDLRHTFPGAPPQSLPPRYEPARAWRWSELTAATIRAVDRTHLLGPVEHLRADAALPLPPQTAAREERDAVIRAAKWTNTAFLPAQSLREFLDAHLHASVSQLESFSSCPFKHFTGYLLRPQALLRPRFESTDAGNFAHAVLCRFTEALRTRALLGKVLEEDLFAEVYEQAEAAPRHRIQRSGLTQDAIGAYMLETLRAQIRSLARWLADAFAALPLRPRFEEIRLRSDPASPFSALRITGLPDDWELTIRGQIDRVDAAPGAPGTQVIVDYKLRPKRFEYSGWDSSENLQLPVYILAVQRSTGAPVAGGLYLNILSKTDDENAKRKYRGILDATLARTLYPDGSWGKMQLVEGAQCDPAQSPPPGWGTAILPGELAELLARTEEKVRELATRLVEGDCRVWPSRHGTTTACRYCEYRALCRLDYRVNRANVKLSRPRAAVLLNLRGADKNVVH